MESYFVGTPQHLRKHQRELHQRMLQSEAKSAAKSSPDNRYQQNNGHLANHPDSLRVCLYGPN